VISELLPPREGGHRYSNSDPVTGQAAWFDLRVKVSKCLPHEAGETEPFFEPVQPRAPFLPEDGVVRYGKDLGTS